MVVELPVVELLVVGVVELVVVGEVVVEVVEIAGVSVSETTTGLTSFEVVDCG